MILTTARRKPLGYRLVLRNNDGIKMYATRKTGRQSLANRGGGSAVYSRNLSFHYQRQPTAFFEPVECSFKSRQFSYKRRGNVSLRRKNRFRF